MRRLLGEQGKRALYDHLRTESGRVPVDMVRKAIRAGVPALVSKTMPTVQSVELAEEYGLRLLIQKKNEFHARIS